MLRKYARVFMVAAILTLAVRPGLTFARPGHAPAPTITITPTAAVPHGSIQVKGVGFDPSTNGKTVLVNIIVTNSTGTFPVGAVQTDASGAINAGESTLRLPFSLDATSANQLVASEDGKAGLAASQLLTGTPLTPALNNGQPLAAKLGDQITINGTGFAPLDVLSLSLGGQALGSGSGPSTTTADANGNVTFALAVPVNVQAGTSLLTLSGSALGIGQHDSASVPLTLSANAGTVAITPNPAAVGTAISVQAIGFQPGEPVTFTLRYFDRGINNFAITNSPTNADTQGSARTTMSIPIAADGNQPASVSARGINSGVITTSPLTLSSQARVTISPSSALPGSRITVLGSGFVSGENLFVTTRLFKAPIGTIAIPDATGHFSATATLLTSLQGGVSYPLSISGTGGDTAGTTFAVLSQLPPSLAINPSNAPAGSTVTASGQGFGGNESVAITIDGNPLSVTGSATSTDGTGAFTSTAVLPVGVPTGTYTVTATGATSGIVKSAPVVVTFQPSDNWYFAEGFTGQGPNVFFQEYLTLLNTTNNPAQCTIQYQFPDGHTSSVPVSVIAHGVLVRNVNNDVGPNQIVSASVKANIPITAERTILRTDAKKRVLDTDVSPGQSSPQSSWFFAEGYSGVTFQPYLTVLSPASSPISLTVTLFPTSGLPKAVSASLPPFGRFTLNLRTVLPGKSFSMSVVASQPIVAERVEYWGAGAGSAKFGAGVKPGVSSPGKVWYFGYSAVLGGDQSFLSVLNPTSQTANVKASVFDGTGNTSRSVTIAVPPGQRGTFLLHTLFGAANHSPLAIRLDSNVNITAEEAQYYGGSPNTGTHTGASIEGRQFTSTRWTFASGNTATYQESEYVLNPSATAAKIGATFYGVDGQVVSVTYAVPAQRVISIAANAVKGLHAEAHGSVWTTVGNANVVVVQVLRAKDGSSALADQGIPG
jgi:hypothetical protein